MMPGNRANRGLPVREAQSRSLPEECRSRIRELRPSEPLRVVTVTGSPIDGELSSENQCSQMFLLGFFRVNLQKAVQVSQNAHSEAEAVSALDALEFFAFGRATQGAVSSCS